MQVDLHLKDHKNWTLDEDRSSLFYFRKSIEPRFPFLATTPTTHLPVDRDLPQKRFYPDDPVPTA